MFLAATIAMPALGGFAHAQDFSGPVDGIDPGVPCEPQSIYEPTVPKCDLPPVDTSDVEYVVGQAEKFVIDLYEGLPKEPPPVNPPNPTDLVPDPGCDLTSCVDPPDPCPGCDPTPCVNAPCPLPVPPLPPTCLWVLCDDGPPVPCVNAPCPSPPVPCVTSECTLPPVPCVTSPCTPPPVPCASGPCEPPDPWDACALTLCGNGTAPPIPCVDTNCPPIMCVNVECIEYPCVNAPCTMPPIVCAVALCSLPSACEALLGCESACFSVVLYCDADAQTLGPVLAEARRQVESAGIDAPEIGDEVELLLSTVLAHLTPARRAAQGAIRDVGGPGVELPDPWRTDSDAPAQYDAFPPGAKKAEDCSDREYWFYAFDRREDGRDVWRHSACYPLAATLLNAPVDGHAWPPGSAVTNRVDFDYDSWNKRAVLTVSNRRADFLGFEIEAADTRLRYEASDFVPSTTRIEFGDLRVGLFDATEAGPRLVLAYAGIEANAWIRMRATPNALDAATYYTLHFGSFKPPFGEAASALAPTDFEFSALFKEGLPGSGTLGVRWGSHEGRTPAAITWTENGTHSVVRLDSLPKSADFLVQFRNVQGESDGYVRLDVAHVDRVWLPLGDPPVMLKDVGSFELNYRALAVSPLDPYGCDEDLTAIVRETKDPTGELQVCLDVRTAKPGAEVHLEGGKARVHSLPAGRMLATLGPSGAVQYEEVESVTGAHAGFEAAGTSLIGSIQSIDVQQVVNATIVPGGTLANGGASESDCGSSGKTDPATGRSDALLEAKFAPGGGVMNISFTAARLQLGRVAKITTDGGSFAVTFTATGGLMGIDADVSNGCETSLHVSGWMSGLTSMRLRSGSGLSEDSPLLLLDSLHGPIYSSVYLEAKTPAKYCDGEMIFQSNLLKTKPRQWSISSDLDWPSSWCGAPGSRVWRNEPGQFVYKLPTVDGMRYYGGYRVGS